MPPNTQVIYATLLLPKLSKAGIAPMKFLKINVFCEEISMVKYMKVLNYQCFDINKIRHICKTSGRLGSTIHYFDTFDFYSIGLSFLCALLRFRNITILKITVPFNLEHVVNVTLRLLVIYI